MIINTEKVARDIGAWYEELLQNLDTEVKTECLLLVLRKKLHTSRDKDMEAIFRVGQLYHTAVAWKLGKVREVKAKIREREQVEARVRYAKKVIARKERLEAKKEVL